MNNVSLEDYRDLFKIQRSNKIKFFLHKKYNSIDRFPVPKLASHIIESFKVTICELIDIIFSQLKRA